MSASRVPVARLGTKEHIWSALQYHPYLKAINTARKYLFQQSFDKLDLYEADGASANDKLYAHICNSATEDNASDQALVISNPCSNNVRSDSHCLLGVTTSSNHDGRAANQVLL